MKKYKALIMDFDLTIADTSDIITKCLLDNARAFGFELNPDDMRRGIGCMPAVIYRTSGILDEKLLDRMEKRYVISSYEPNMKLAKFYPGVREGLGALREKGIATAIFSQKQRELMTGPMEREGIAGLICETVGLFDVEKTKPNPEGMELIRDRLGLLNGDILYTGDSLTDEATARAAGVDFAAVLTGVTPRDAFDAAGAVGLYDSFLELCFDMVKDRK